MDVRTVRVELGQRSYDILSGDGLAHDAVLQIRDLIGERPQHAFAVVDDGVPETQRDAVVAALNENGFNVTFFVIEPSEQIKSIDVWHILLGKIAATRHERTDPVIAIGGGIIGDLGGFVAATYKRGVPFVQIPTTLLAMVDASVGGKTGVNLALPADNPDDDPALLKNMVGAFHQPRLVVADVAMLASLDERVFRAGLGECVKHGMIASGVSSDDLLGWTEANTDAICAHDPGTLIELVERNVRLKARVVADDERESGVRMLLNLGHTYAHAIETLGGLVIPNCPHPDASRGVPAPVHHEQTPGLQHGEAVALGLIAACAAGESLGLIERAYRGRIEALLDRLGLPIRVAELPDDATLLARMAHDKKSSGGTIRLIVPDGVGSARIIDNPPTSAVAAGWAAIRQSV